MVDRYKKSGGFVQLLQIIETCGPKKYDQFMGIITEEDPSWAEAIKNKMLTFDRILNWSPEAILEVLANVNPLAVATALKSLPADKLQKFLSNISHQDKRRIETQLGEIKPNQNEISSCVMKVVSETRALLTSGTIKPMKVDQTLVIPENFEEKLSSKVPSGLISDELLGAEPAAAMPVATAPAVGNASFAAGTAGAVEFEKMQKKLVLLTREYQTIKQENSVLKDKLEKIKKIA